MLLSFLLSIATVQADPTLAYLSKTVSAALNRVEIQLGNEAQVVAGEDRVQMWGPMPYTVEQRHYTFGFGTGQPNGAVVRWFPSSAEAKEWKALIEHESFRPNYSLNLAYRPYGYKGEPVLIDWFTIRDVNSLQSDCLQKQWNEINSALSDPQTFGDLIRLRQTNLRRSLSPDGKSAIRTSRSLYFEVLVKDHFTRHANWELVEKTSNSAEEPSTALVKLGFPNSDSPDLSNDDPTGYAPRSVVVSVRARIDHEGNCVVADQKSVSSAFFERLWAHL
ncbi:MAG: hypothetical protein AB7P04_05440 [Bacteriovoracia bacterium]